MAPGYIQADVLRTSLSREIGRVGPGRISGRVLNNFFAPGPAPTLERVGLRLGFGIGQLRQYTPITGIEKVERGRYKEPAARN